MKKVTQAVTTGVLSDVEPVSEDDEGDSMRVNQTTDADPGAQNTYFTPRCINASHDDAPFVAEPDSDNDSECCEGPASELEFQWPETANIVTGDKELPALWDLESFSRALVCPF